MRSRISIFSFPRQIVRSVSNTFAAPDPANRSILEAQINRRGFIQAAGLGLLCLLTASCSDKAESLQDAAAVAPDPIFQETMRMTLYLMNNQKYVAVDRKVPLEAVARTAVKNGWTVPLLDTMNREVESQLKVLPKDCVPHIIYSIYQGVRGYVDINYLSNRKEETKIGQPTGQYVRVHLSGRAPNFSSPETVKIMVRHEIGHARLSAFKPFMAGTRGRTGQNYTFDRDAYLENIKKYILKRIKADQDTVNKYPVLKDNLEEIVAWSMFDQEDPAAQRAVGENTGHYVDNFLGKMTPGRDYNLDAFALHLFICRTFKQDNNYLENTYARLPMQTRNEVAEMLGMFNRAWKLSKRNIVPKLK
jgi:hypothetical protein